MKKYIALLVISLLLLTACSTTTPTGSTTIEEPTNWNGEVKEFTVEAYQFGFKPDRLVVNKGDKVILTAYSSDVPHGLYINKYNINMILNGPERKTIEFIADKEGTFQFFCSVSCGRGHGSMRGVLVVNP